MGKTDTTEATVMLSKNQAPRSSLLRRSSSFGYEGRKLQDILRNSPTRWPTPCYRKSVRCLRPMSA
jgi:hypothetical protein